MIVNFFFPFLNTFNKKHLVYSQNLENRVDLRIYDNIKLVYFCKVPTLRDKTI